MSRLHDMELSALRVHLESLHDWCQDLRAAQERWEILKEYVKETVITAADRALVASVLLHPQHGLFHIMDVTLRLHGNCVVCALHCPPCRRYVLMRFVSVIVIRVSVTI